MKTLRWTDVHDIAIALDEVHPDVDVMGVRFTDLHRWILALPDFKDDPERSNEKILEAIQMAWLEERS
jgi:FeS assembly protein IscX